MPGMRTDPAEPPAWWPAPDELGSAVWRAQRSVERAADAALSPAGLSTAVFRVLRLVDREPGQSAADLARHLGFAPQSVSAVIDSAERAGYLARRPHPVHGRVRRLFLTDHGQATLRHGRRLIRVLERELAEGLDTTARGLLSRQLLGVALKAEAIAVAAARAQTGHRDRDAAQTAANTLPEPPLPARSSRQPNR